ILRPIERDRLYDEGAWLSDVRQQVAEHVDAARSGREANVAIVGYHKDASSYYLSLFPEWEYVSTPYYQNINSTDIRNVYFALDPEDTVLAQPAIANCVPAPTRDSLERFRQDERYRHLCEEFVYVRSYRQSWSVAPYPPILVVVNALVLHSECLLVIRRRHQPGRGTLALPGGFLEPEETLQAATVRELREETHINVPAAHLQQAIAAQHVFDRPQRSLRGRAIAHVTVFQLATDSLPQVEGGDDASQAWWLPLQELSAFEDRFFADHYQIIRYALACLR
ncbi:MAG: NUDIX domain-containing protein, partial [Cyanobacteria bacterium J06648_11]